MAAASDEHVGAFTPTGPWVVVPEQMAWRQGIDDLRASTQARVPELIHPRRLPPAHGLKVAARLARAVAPPVLRYRRRLRQPEGQQDLAGNLRLAFESLGTTFIKLGQLVASSDGMLADTLVQEFKLCRDRVPAEPFSPVRAVVEEDLGRPWAHGEYIETVGVDRDALPRGAEGLAEMMRRQSGIDSESATVQDLHKTNTERIDAIRAAQRHQQPGLDE